MSSWTLSMSGEPEVTIARSSVLQTWVLQPSGSTQFYAPSRARRREARQLFVASQPEAQTSITEATAESAAVPKQRWRKGASRRRGYRDAKCFRTPVARAHVCPDL